MSKRIGTPLRAWSALPFLALAMLPRSGAAGDRPQHALVDVVLVGAHPPSSLDVKKYPTARVPCLERYLAAWNAQEGPGSTRQGACATGPDLSCRRERLAQQIVLLLGMSTAGEAKTFAATVPLYLEWEGQIVPLEKGLLPITEKRYREHLKKAQESRPPLIHCVADDLEALPYVYLPPPVRP